MVGTGDYQKIAKVLDRVEKGEIVNEVSKIPEFTADGISSLILPKIDLFNDACQGLFMLFNKSGWLCWSGKSK